MLCFVARVGLVQCALKFMGMGRRLAQVFLGRTVVWGLGKVR